LGALEGAMVSMSGKEEQSHVYHLNYQYQKNVKKRKRKEKRIYVCTKKITAQISNTKANPKPNSSLFGAIVEIFPLTSSQTLFPHRHYLQENNKQKARHSHNQTINNQLHVGILKPEQYKKTHHSHYQENVQQGIFSTNRKPVKKNVS
jgi:hypothetical protein